MTTLTERAENACELCAATTDLSVFDIGPDPDQTPDTQALLCITCASQISDTPDPNHWRALSTSMWSQHAPVQVLAWRMLNRLSDHGWARDLADMLYLDEKTLVWAQSGAFIPNIIHRDCNGIQLAAGDTVTLIKDLPVKGAGFTAKRGTAVRSVSLVADNSGHIEGRVEGQRITILTEFVKKR